MATPSTTPTPAPTIPLLAPGQSAFQTPAAIPAIPTTPVVSPISVQSLQTPATPFKVTQSAPSTEMTGLGGVIESNANAFTADLETKAKEAEVGKNKSLAALIKEMEGSKGELGLTADAYKKDVDPLESDLKDINQQILAEQQSSRRAEEAFRKNPQGLFGGALEQGIQDIRDKSIARQADLSVIQLARQGRYDSAKAIADRAVSAKLEKQRSVLDVLKLNYEDNKEKFSKSEQREFETKQADRERLLDKEEQDLKQISDLSLDALQNGAPVAVASAMRNAKTPEEAMRIGGQYVGALDRQIKNQQIAKLAQELAPNDTSAQGDLAAYAVQFADTGKLPSVSELKQSGLTVSQVTEYAKQVPKAPGTLVSAQTGTKSSSISPSQEDGILAMYDIIKKVAELKELDKERVKGLTSAAAGKVFGFKDQENYLALRQEIVDLLSRARTGAALTASEEKFYADQLPGRIGQVGFGLFGANTSNRIDNFSNKIKGTLDTKLAGYGTVIYNYSKVKVNGVDRTVGEILDIGGTKYKVLPDGTLTDII